MSVNYTANETVSVKMFYILIETDPNFRHPCMHEQLAQFIPRLRSLAQGPFSKIKTESYVHLQHQKATQWELVEHSAVLIRGSLIGLLLPSIILVSQEETQ